MILAKSNPIQSNYRHRHNDNDYYHYYYYNHPYWHNYDKKDSRNHDLLNEMQ